MAFVSEIIHDKEYLSRVLDASINIGLTALLVISCLLILRPFVPLLVWGIIIAIASYPRFEKLKNLLGGRGGWSAVIWTLLLLLILIFPIFLLARGVVESGQNQANVSKHLKMLAEAGMVRRRKEGLQVFYSVGDPLIEKLCGLVCGTVIEEAQSEVDRHRKLLKTWQGRS